ncbi:DUF2326 domain-containing protein [Aeromonas allosaccharophila]|uniref:DUF2326 domain-containing protein n=1 Tax=Aeromonas allosaccharophila TaxID=656 RepID=UPI0013C63047|nr:DUF2326 domain-containing protein [Aeromonas allosaccharophila]WDO00549.1 DUF2326 domain-containing protein [Aeromonas allosaccharophila]
MIKLIRIYSNKRDVFPDINFHDGLNVVFASVSKHLNKKSSHSLGKTTLIDVIDFCLLKQIDKTHIFKKTCFSEFVFFLEIKYSPTGFVTIKRPVDGKISISVKNESMRFTYGDESDWEWKDISLAEAKKKLNNIICPKQISYAGFTYRNGLRYCFRKQTQYENTFKVNNSRESDSGWTPYLSSVIGINSSVVQEKYQANKKVESIKSAIKEVKNIPTDSGQGLEAEITQIESSVQRMRAELDRFDFKKADSNVSDELINEVSENVSLMVKEVYSLDQKISAIKKSLQAEFSFEMDKVLELFKEVNVHFPAYLSKSYEDLINLNRSMSIGRKERLAHVKSGLLKEREGIVENLDYYRAQQQELTSLLLQKDAFEKYKQLQNRLVMEETRVAVLNERLAKIDLAAELGKKLQLAESEQTVATKNLEAETKIRGNETLTNAVSIFSELVDNILSISAFFYTDTNKDGNIQFKIGLKDQTALNEGFSYTRVLSAIFDVTLLKLYANGDFYRFCYHDGILESLDDRLKLNLIKEWREISTTNELQFIITVLDSDLPLIDDKKTYFSSNEIIRELNDHGDNGRLFRMPAF